MMVVQGKKKKPKQGKINVPKASFQRPGSNNHQRIIPTRGPKKINMVNKQPRNIKEPCKPGNYKDEMQGFYIAVVYSHQFRI